MLKFIFDLDGTITSCETLPLIAKHFNIEEEIEQLTKDTVQGLIHFEKSFEHRVSILGKLPVNEVKNFLENIVLLPKIHKFILDNPECCVIATGNLSCWIEKLVARLHCESYSSSATVKDNKISRLTNILDKKEICTKYKKLGYHIVFIGDGDNDVEAMKIADIAIASAVVHNPPQSVINTADFTFYDENDLYACLEKIRNVEK